MTTKKIEVDVVVLGSGPGGYSSAFRTADLGKKVALVEYYDNLGGVCLNVGCIPSKALLHAAKVIDESENMGKYGIQFDKPKINLNKLRLWKDSVIKRLTQGLQILSKQRKIEIIHGYGKFISSNTMLIESSKGNTKIKFTNAIIAVGSKPVKLPFLPNDARIMDSTSALSLDNISDNLLIIGGGVIGMELGTIYSALGSKVTVIELTQSILPGVDQDLVIPLQKRMKGKFEAIYTENKITDVEIKNNNLWVTFEDKKGLKEKQRFDKILSAVGRVPNGKEIDAHKAGVEVNKLGFIKVDSQQKTNVEHIFAIGDVVGNPMLAHKSISEGKIAAEVICGYKHHFEPSCIPSVAYTDPEVAWVGKTENQAKTEKLDYGKGSFSWMANGRALIMNRGEEGITKVLFDKKTNQVIGVGIVGPHAGDLIAEAALAIEMGCEASDLALTIHPHPTLSETICQATEIFEGTITDLYMPKKLSV